MNPFEFDEQMARMKDAHDRFYNKARVDMIFKIVKDMPDGAFVKMCDYFIETQRQPPTPQDFRKAAYQFRSKTDFRNEDDPKQLFNDCDLCGDFGFLSCSNEFTKTICKCDCKWGQGVERDLPNLALIQKRGWTSKKMDLSWFKPKSESVNKSDGQQLVRKWTAIVKDAEKFWHEYYSKMPVIMLNKLIDQQTQACL